MSWIGNTLLIELQHRAGPDDRDDEYHAWLDAGRVDEEAATEAHYADWLRRVTTELEKEESR